MQPERAQDVISITDYLRETVREADAYILRAFAHRTEIACRLYALESAMEPSVVTADEDAIRRVEEDDPYPARSVADVIAEAREQHLLEV